MHQILKNIPKIQNRVKPMKEDKLSTVPTNVFFLFIIGAIQNQEIEENFMKPREAKK